MPSEGLCFLWPEDMCVPSQAAGGWEGKELGGSKFALRQGAKELPGVLEAHGRYFQVPKEQLRETKRPDRSILLNFQFRPNVGHGSKPLPLRIFL